jgi:hypothetical protein
MSRGQLSDHAENAFSNSSVIVEAFIVVAIYIAAWSLYTEPLLSNGSCTAPYFAVAGQRRVHMSQYYMRVTIAVPKVVR